MENSTCDELMDLLNFVEYVVIDGKRTELFQKRINYICLANCFASTMKRDYHCKQIKTFLKKHGGFEDSAAQQIASKLNEARCVFQLIDEVTFEMENSTCDELMDLLNFVEYVVIDGKMTE